VRREERSIGVHVVKTNCFIMTGAHDGDKSEDDRSCTLFLQLYIKYSSNGSEWLLLRRVCVCRCVLVISYNIIYYYCAVCAPLLLVRYVLLPSPIFHIITQRPPSRARTYAFYYIIYIYIYMIITHNVMMIAEKHTRGTNRPIYVAIIF